MRWLPVSATKTLPFRSTATASGSKNCPSPLPWLPNLPRKAPHAAVAVVGVAVGLLVAVNARGDVLVGVGVSVELRVAEAVEIAVDVSVGVAVPTACVGLLVGAG
jgi:hypothetical protein